MVRTSNHITVARIWWQRRQRLNTHRRLYRRQTRRRAPLPERYPRLAYLFALVPVVAMIALLAGAPPLYKLSKIISPAGAAPPAPINTCAENDPTCQPQASPLPPWNGTDPLTFLVVGVDKREDDIYSRTDTMILVTVDPVAKTAGIMSLPRDLRVNIRYGYGADKLNASFVYGDADRRPGGGIGLLKQTIYDNFRVPVDYYALVDFRGFERVVDTFGGVDVDPPYPLVDDEYPTETLGYTGLYFAAGWQHLDGQAALRYARTRHPDNDLARSRRQQEVMLSLREQALNRHLVTKIGALLDILSSSVRTDFPGDKLTALADLATSIPRQNIKIWTLQDLLRDYVDENGIYFAVADWPKVRARLREMIPSLSTTAPSPSPDPTARVAVRNGTERPGFAGRSVDRLKRAGFTGSFIDPDQTTDTRPVATTIIFDYAGKSDVAILIARQLGIPESAVRQGTGAQPPGADIVIVLGTDAPDSTPRTVPTPTRTR